MNYQEWYDTHAKKHRTIINRLQKQGYDQDAIIDYFVFENMVKQEPDFCLLYETSTKCHDIPYLNCYFCACPHFRFHDDPTPDVQGLKQFSHCAIDSDKGAFFEHNNARHQDCSNCLIPHKKHYISKHFDVDWKGAMADCPIQQKY